MSTVEENREKMRRFIEEVDQNKDVDALPEYVHEDIELPADIIPNGTQGIEGLREHLLYLPSVVEYHSTVEDLIASVSEGNEDLKTFDASCFSGEYVTGVQADYLRELEFARSDEAKNLRRVS